MILNKRTTLFLWFVAVTTGICQIQPRATFNHSIKLRSEDTPRRQTATSVIPDTLRVLCAMVEFQPDDDSRTSGNGSFDRSDSVQKIIDPPPHNKAYFEQHVTFARNYFRKVSDEKFTVIGDVLDSVYMLPNKMQYYSPPRNSTGNTALGWLVHDTWRAVDSVTPGIPFSNYDAFIIFHAGVGRDVASDIQELDPTPFDIPSIYFGLASLQSIFGASYQGVPVADSTMFINNSMILPETESRKYSSIAGTFLLQLGINGLLVASIGSHLGLLDLFDTKTGRTGIGRFGLMDGQSIFSWNGVFPPEPSAWEKQFLGWVEPITISSGDEIYPLPAVSKNNSSDTIYKVLISAREYFLIENRNRDANRDSAIITTIFYGDTLRKAWRHDTSNFNAYDIDSIYGNVIDVDEFDWSLPGGVNSRTNEWFDGGTLVWHIDEDVINANLSTNSVNADPDHRGVDLEEADGSQDIGQSYEFLEPGSGSEDGTALDFWYEGNSAPVRFKKNRFTPTTFPNSNSYSGANSHIYLKDFSTRSPRMTVKIQIGDDDVKVTYGFPKYVGPIQASSSIHIYGIPNSAGVVTSTENGIFAWDISKNAPAFPSGNTNGIIANRTLQCSDGYFGTLAVKDFNNDGIPELVQSENGCHLPFNQIGSLVSFWSLKDTNTDGQADKFKELLLDYNSTVTSPVVTDSFFAFGLSDGLVSFNKLDGSHSEVSFTSTASERIVGLSAWEVDKFIVTLSNGTVYVTRPYWFLSEKKISDSLSAPAIAGTISSTIGKCIVVATPDGDVYLLKNNLSPLSGFPFSTHSEIANAPALADIDNDGQRDIVVFSGNKIWAINAAGAVLDNFPITISTVNTILTSPVIADIDVSGTADIVAVTQEGLVVAYDKTGKLLSGFPLQSGKNSGTTPVIFTNPGLHEYSCCLDIGLVVISDDGYMYSWTTGYTSEYPLPTTIFAGFPWPQYMHDAQNTGLVEDPLTLTPRSNEFLPAALAYNWPNPVGVNEGYKTHIRYFVRENAAVEIKILDLAGDLVATMQGPGVGGLDNEIEWDVSSIESGIYFAHIEAKGATTGGTAIIKIAVVK
ncbi:MAG: hypothetical protein EPO24_11460 [Bacteroidetes bacterium]|nr:MAG: hypothetical protein EPO24_11460 [Bacteroidota bacterium]